MDYKAMLTRGRKQMPDELETAERFEIPNVKGHQQGNKTIISNMGEIARKLGRKLELLVKFIEKQLATRAIIEKNFVIFNAKLSAGKINIRIQQFADQFVFCKECGKPDTTLTKDTGVYFLKCSACGAKYSLTSRI